MNQYKPTEPTEYNFYPAFEPRNVNRFIVYINDIKSKKLIIPYFLIKSITRPSYFRTCTAKQKHWKPVWIEVYESVIPTNIYFHMLRASLFDITVKELGPVGDVVGMWMMTLCRWADLQPQILNWSNSEMCIIKAEIDWKEIIVYDGDDELKITKE